jgi:hypothetical protein
MKPDGSDLVRLTGGPGPDQRAAWSPDGQQIALRRQVSGSAGGIWTMNADGSGLHQILNFGTSYGLDWQPIPLNYVKPRGATPINASLVPAYVECTSPNRTHGAPLSYPSCTQGGVGFPPDGTMRQESPNLTIGTPDANGARANFVGSLRLDVHPGNSSTPADEADVGINVSATDIRCMPGVQPSACGGPNCCDGPDYVGELQGVLDIRITDRNNSPSPGGSGPATMANVPFSFTVPCVETHSDTSQGGACSTATSADAVVPGVVKESERAIWQLGQIEVFDGGPDGDVATADNSLFLRQGVFVP